VNPPCNVESISRKPYQPFKDVVLMSFSGQPEVIDGLPQRLRLAENVGTGQIIGLSA